MAPGLSQWGQGFRTLPRAQTDSGAQTVGMFSSMIDVCRQPLPTKFIPGLPDFYP